MISLPGMCARFAQENPLSLGSQMMQHPVEVAKALLGCYLVHSRRVARIVEVEAYGGIGELGSHAAKGMTPRTQVMFGPPGHAYVYFTYGTHWMLNVVAHEAGEAGAVLIRAAEPLEGLDLMFEGRPRAKAPEDLLSGPGKLAAAFGLGPEHNGLPLFSEDSPLRIVLKHSALVTLCGTRVGLAKGKGDELPWRFVDADALRWVSKPHRFYRD